MTMIPAPVHFLLVDDLEENLTALEGLLRREGLVLLKARSGTEALELLLQHEVALAIVDVQMPGMSGFELADLIRGMERTRRIPIIFVTAGVADQQRRFRGYEAGAVDFIRKPIETAVLRSKAEVFYELYRQRQEVAQQRDELKAATEENARLLADSRRTAEKLRLADTKKDEFLAMLAHELRNPLSAIASGVRLLGKPGTEKDREWIQTLMQRQVSQLKCLLDDLLEVSRITTGKITLKRERLPLGEIVDRAVQAVSPLFETREVEFQVGSPGHSWIFADAARVEQILVNLLSNAAKYTPAGGSVTLEFRNTPEQVIIAVQDTGIGISAEMLPLLFELFSQDSRTLDRSEGGLGIGLAIVKRLVEMHGGSVTAASQGTGKGSTFTVVLPTINLDEIVMNAPSHEESVGVRSSKRILIVDDNADMSIALAMLLESEGHQTRVVHHGRDALALLPDFSPEVALLDIGLPEINGYELAGRVRETEGGEEMTLIAISGYGQEKDRVKSARAGFQHHLVKPVDFEMLLKLLSDCPG